MSARQVASIVTRVIKSFLKVQNVNSVQKRRSFTKSMGDRKSVVLVMLKNAILKILICCNNTSRYFGK